MGLTFKQNLKELLEYYDLTIKELAFTTGISPRSIENYLNSRESMPPADYAYKIAMALNTTVEYLVSGEDSKNNNLKYSEKLLSVIKLYPLLKDENQTLVLELIKSLK